MIVFESPDYQAACDLIKGNPVIAMMAAGVATVPPAEIAHQDGTPRSGFMNQASRAFDAAEARNAGNPGYQPYPAGAPRHIGLIAEAVLAERAAIREAVASALAAPATSPESAGVTAIAVDDVAAEFARLVAARRAVDPATRRDGTGDHGVVRRHLREPDPDSAAGIADAGRLAGGPGRSGVSRSVRSWAETAKLQARRLARTLSVVIRAGSHLADP